MRIAIIALAVAVACAAEANGIDPQAIAIDFGVPDPNVDPLADPNQWTPTGGNWNMAWYVAGTTQVFNNLIDEAGTPTGIGLSVPSGWDTDGPGGMDANNLYPYEAQKDSIGCDHNATSQLILTGLTEPEYTIKIFGSRHSGAWGYPLYRKGQFTIGGFSQIQDHAGNTASRLTFANIAPDPNGQIVIDVVGVAEPPENFGWASVNVMEVIIPEPATMGLLAVGGLLAIRRRRR